MPGLIGSGNCVLYHGSILSISRSGRQTQKKDRVMNKVNWLSYGFDVYSPNTTWNDVPGIYIFTGLNAVGRWRAFYIGQASSFKDRFANHENWAAAVRLGATHVHALVVQQAATRDNIEAELIAACQPSLNVQLK